MVPHLFFCEQWVKELEYNVVVTVVFSRPTLTTVKVLPKSDQLISLNVMGSSLVPAKKSFTIKAEVLHLLKFNSVLKLQRRWTTNYS